MQRNPTALDLNGPGREPTSVERYLAAYGTCGMTLLVSQFVQRAPEFKGDQAIAAELGVAVAMLEAALNEVADSIPSLNPTPKDPK